MVSQNSLDKRLSYLSIADFDYLSARILLLFGLATTGLPKAAEAVEKLLKLFLLLEAKIIRNEELFDTELKKYGHGLTTLFNKIKPLIPANFDKTWDDYFHFLQETYTKRYPEDWRSFKYEIDVGILDSSYLYLRNGIIQNFPIEERERVKQFGGFISNSYTEKNREIIKKTTNKSLREILLQDNQHIGKYDLDLTRL